MIPCNRDVRKKCSTLRITLSKFDSKSTSNFCNTRVPIHTKGLWLVSSNNKIIYLISFKIPLKNKNVWKSYSVPNSGTAHRAAHPYFWRGMKKFVSISRTRFLHFNVILKNSNLADNHTFHNDTFLQKSRKALNSALTTEKSY